MKLSAIFIMSIILVGPLAFAGNEGGHGGGGFICPNASDSEFLDLYEARENGLNIPLSSEPVESQIQKALIKLKLAGIDIFKTYSSVKSAKIIPLPPNKELAWPSDALNKYAKAGCSAKGIMLYHDKKNKKDVDSIDQDTASLNSLPNTDQAAAWVHETVYKFLRSKFADKDSVRARTLVGHLFSNEDSMQVSVVYRSLFVQGACLLSWPQMQMCVRMEKEQCKNSNGVFIGGPCW